MAIKIFVRQPLTQSGPSEAHIVQGILDGIIASEAMGTMLELVTGKEALDCETFHDAFEAETGEAFSPCRFRRKRLDSLSQADVMLVIRTGLSESGAFEIAYNIFGGRKIPIFFAVWEKAEIKTTFLRELEELVDVTYITFREPFEIVPAFECFLENVVIPNMAVHSPRADDIRIAASFRAARHAARELGFPVIVHHLRGKTPSRHIANLAELSTFAERMSVRPGAGSPLIIEKTRNVSAMPAKTIPVESLLFDQASYPEGRIGVSCAPQGEPL